MKPAEFEEREYEASLYNQLATGDRRVWSPGQVFEAHVGFDHALFTTDVWLFRLHGYRSYLPGTVLARYLWPQLWFRRRTPRALPTFRLNLFIQAKRPLWGRRAPASVRAKGLGHLFWRFDIDGEQQAALGKVAAKLKGRALVVYAAPAFHQHSALWLHTCRGTIVPNSTFPSVVVLGGHEAWYYTEPGARGVANPDPTAMDEPSLSDRMDQLLAGGVEATESWRRELTELGLSIHDALAEEALGPTSRLAAFFGLLRQFRSDVDGLEESDVLFAFLTIVAFSEVFLVDWYVLGPP